MYQNKHPYTFLNGKINILHVQSINNSQHDTTNYLKNYFLYRVKNFYIENDIDKYLNLRFKDIHVLILNLNFKKIEENNFSLIRKYSKKLPIIILTDSADIEKGFLACKYGAEELLSKPLDLKSLKLVEIINKLFLKFLSMPSKVPVYDDLIIFCSDILREKRPNTVAEWAMNANIAECYLRKKWSLHFSIKPKYTHFLYILFSDAIKFCNKNYPGNSQIDYSHIWPSINKRQKYFTRNRLSLERAIYC